MNEVKGGVERREKGTATWEQVGRLLAHMLMGAVLLVGMVAIETLVILAVRFLTGFAGDHLFSFLAEAMEVFFEVVDMVVAVSWVVRSVRKAFKEEGDSRE